MNVEPYYSAFVWDFYRFYAHEETSMSHLRKTYFAPTLSAFGDNPTLETPYYVEALYIWHKKIEESPKWIENCAQRLHRLLTKCPEYCRVFREVCNSRNTEELLFKMG